MAPSSHSTLARFTLIIYNNFLIHANHPYLDATRHDFWTQNITKMLVRFQRSANLLFGGDASQEKAMKKRLRFVSLMTDTWRVKRCIIIIINGLRDRTARKEEVR